MPFVKKFGDKYYVVRKIFENRTWKSEILRLATHEEIEKFLNQCSLICANPKCNNTIILTKDQKQKFMVTYPLRYKKLVLVYCSRKCRDEHAKELMAKIEKENGKDDREG